MVALTKEKRWHAEEAWPKKRREKKKEGNHMCERERDQGMIKEREPHFKE